MSKILLLSSSSVKKVRNSHPALKGKKLLASGMFSGVYEGSTPNTVLKLTICPGTCSMLLDSKLRSSKHQPKIIHDYGCVGAFTTGTNVIETKITKPVKRLVPMYLIEVEKLNKLTPKSETMLFAKRLSKLMQNALAGEDMGATERQMQILRDTSAEPTISAYFDGLIDFVARNKGRVFFDMHPANMMQRSDGTLVFSDPIGSTEIFDTQGVFANLSNGDIEWSEVIQDHKKKFGHLVKRA